MTAREPLFCDAGLAERIERSEAGRMAAASEAARRRSGEPPGFVVPIAGGMATFASAGSPFNKISGLGFCGIPAPGELARVERAFAARGAPAQAEVSSLADPELGTVLTGRGYRLVSFENVLGRLPGGRAGGDRAGGDRAGYDRAGGDRAGGDRAGYDRAGGDRARGGQAGSAEARIEVNRAGSGEFEVWLEVVLDGFAHADDEGVPSHEEFPREVVAAAQRDFASTGALLYLARRDGVAAGGAGMLLADGIAHVAGAATVPAHRRRGVQTALLAARLADAAAGACDLAVVTTQPGSVSQRNVQRHGFDLLYTRAVLVKQPS